MIASSFISLLERINSSILLSQYCIVSCKCTHFRDITNIKIFVNKGNGTCQMKSITWFLPTLLGKSYNAFNSMLNSAYNILYGCDISDTISLVGFINYLHCVGTYNWNSILFKRLFRIYGLESISQYLSCLLLYITY